MAERYGSLKKTSRRRWSAAWRWLGLLTLLILIGAAGAAVFLNAERFALRAIEISGNRLLTEEMLMATARQALAGRRWRFFQRDRYWFYSPAQLSAALGARFPRLAAVAVGTNGWNTLQLQITERRTAALWCPTPLEAEFSTAADCFYLDETGLAFAPAPHFSISPLVTIVGSDPPFASSSPLINSQPLPRSGFLYLLSLPAALEKFFQPISPFHNFIVQKIIALADGDYKFYFVDPYQPTAGFDVIIAKTQTAAKILDRLKSVFAVPEFRAELNTPAQLEYLDLRFGHKIFYRFRE